MAKGWYPHKVLSETDTMEAVVGGISIARYGDGEFNLVRGGNCVSQRAAPGLRDELASILNSKDNRCIVGIPRLDPRSPKYANWSKCCAHYGAYLNPKKYYGSAFITRPDSAPWIATDDYYEAIQSLWTGKRITMVYGSQRSLSKDFPALGSAAAIDVVETDYAHTYHRIDELEAATVLQGNKVVLLMCGPTATCLAYRLAVQGFHAIDLGHIGMWWDAHKNPKLVGQLKYDANAHP